MAIKQKDIKIYLASADDLELEYNEILNLVKELNKVFNPRQVNLELIPHNKTTSKIEECELTLALYYTKFGEYSNEEFKSAYNSLKKGENPKKIYVFFKDAENVTQDLKDFKDNFVINFGHFFCKFKNVDTLKLNFLMQVEAYHNKFENEKLITFKGHKIYFDTYEIVDLDNIPFASLNIDYTRMRDDLVKYNKEIEDLRLKIVQYPEDEDFQNDLQENLNARNKLESGFKQHQQALFNTAFRVAKISHHQMSDRLQRGINAFENGRASEANAILSEAERDADNFMQNYREHKALLEEEKTKIELSMDELLFKAEVVMLDLRYSIKERVEEVIRLYLKVREIALEIEYDKNEYRLILEDFISFASHHSRYKLALQLCQEELDLCVKLFGENSFIVCLKLNHIAILFHYIGDYNTSLKYYLLTVKAYNDSNYQNDNFLLDVYINISQTLTGYGKYTEAKKYLDESSTLVEKNKHINLKTKSHFYFSFGLFYKKQGLSEKSLEYYYPALEMFKDCYGYKSNTVATLLDNIGNVYTMKNDLDEAMKYYLEAQLIFEEIFGEVHIDCATNYNNIADIYSRTKMYDQAIKYHNKAIKIKQLFSSSHYMLGISYDNLGSVYQEQKKYEISLDYKLKALEILTKHLGERHPETGIVYGNLYNLYTELEDYTNAAEYGYKYLVSLKENKGINDIPVTFFYLEWVKTLDEANKIWTERGELNKVIEYDNAYREFMLERNIKFRGVPQYLLDLEQANEYIKEANTLLDQEKFDEALPYYFEALKIQEEKLESRYNEIAQLYNHIGETYEELEDYQNALKYYLTEKDICEEHLGFKYTGTANSYISIAQVYNLLKEFKKADEYYNKALAVRLAIFGNEHLSIAILYENMAFNLLANNELSSSINYFLEVVKINSKILGDDHLALAKSYSNLAMAYEKNSDSVKSEAYYAKAQAIKDEQPQ